MADIDEIKATFDQAVGAFNSRNLETFLSCWHDQVVLFDPDTPFPVDGKAAFRQAVQAIFANSESAFFVPINPQFRVIGNVGVAWGHFALPVKPKDGPMQTTFGRVTITFTKSDEKWLAVAQHLSRIPSGSSLLKGPHGSGKGE